MMEENIGEASPVAPLAPSKIGEQPAKPWLKIIVFLVLGLLLATSLVWAGVQIGKQYATRDTQYAIRTSPIPSPLISPSPTLLPTFSPEATSSLDETAGWKTYTDTTHSFSLRYPSLWQITRGNRHAPSIPSEMTEMINLQSEVDAFDVSIIPWHNNLKKDLNEELSSFISGFLGDFDVSYKSTQLDKYPALEGSYLQSSMGSQTKVVITAVEKGNSVFFFQTQFDVNNASRLEVYNRLLSAFKFLD